MKYKQESSWPLLLMVVVLAIIGALYFRGLQEPINGLHDLSLPSAPGPVAATPDERVSPLPEAAVIHPIDQAEASREAAASQLSPATVTTDTEPVNPQAPFEAGLEALLGSTTFVDLVVSDDLINRIVVSVDNLSHEKLPQRLWPLRPVGGLPVVNSGLGPLTFGAANGARYEVYVKLLQRLDLKQLAALYVRDYGRFQQAYEALGYPKAYFNDRLVDVIDHLLVTPDLSTPPGLVQPTVMYKFADEGLESRSVGQKVLLRIGSANAAIVKARLRELRRLITRGAP